MGEYLILGKIVFLKFSHDFSQCGIIDIQGGQLVKFVFNESTRYPAGYALCTHNFLLDWVKICIFPPKNHKKSIFLLKLKNYFPILRKKYSL